MKKILSLLAIVVLTLIGQVADAQIRVVAPNQSALAAVGDTVQVSWTGTIVGNPEVAAFIDNGEFRLRISSSDTNVSARHILGVVPDTSVASATYSARIVLYSFDEPVATGQWFTVFARKPDIRVSSAQLFCPDVMEWVAIAGAGTVGKLGSIQVRNDTTNTVRVLKVPIGIKGSIGLFSNLSEVAIWATNSGVGTLVGKAPISHAPLTLNRTLGVGMKGPDVLNLSLILNGWFNLNGLSAVTESSVFNWELADAVELFKLLNSIFEEGCGEQTIATLNSFAVDVFYSSSNTDQVRYWYLVKYPHNIGAGQTENLAVYATYSPTNEGAIVGQWVEVFVPSVSDIFSDAYDLNTGSPATVVTENRRDNRNRAVILPASQPVGTLQIIDQGGGSFVFSCYCDPGRTAVLQYWNSLSNQWVDSGYQSIGCGLVKWYLVRPFRQSGIYRVALR